MLPAGDAFITYPWREKNSIHSSIRLESTRDGIEDYELLNALGSRDPDRARQLARKAVPITFAMLPRSGDYRRSYSRTAQWNRHAACSASYRDKEGCQLHQGDSLAFL